MKTQSNENYWKDRQISWVDHYWSPDHSHRKEIIKILKKFPVRSVLEIGCGAGANLFNIKREFPEIKVAGCDISEDAIRTAKEQFGQIQVMEDSPKNVAYSEHPAQAEKKAMGDIFINNPHLEDVEFKVGSADALPFHGDSFDLVLTDAFLIYIGPDKIERILREIRRVGYNKFMFVEFHSTKLWERLFMRYNIRGNPYWIKKLNSNKFQKRSSKTYVYDYGKLLEEDNFKYIRIMKMSKEMWPGKTWERFGHIVTCIR